MKRAWTIFDRILGSLSFLASILIIFIMLVVCAEIVFRIIGSISLVWVIEITEYSLLWMTFLATAWVLKKEGHVTMDMVVERLNPKNQSLLNTITSVIGALVCLVIAWFSAQVVWQYFQAGYTIPRFIQPPAYIVMVIIPVGSFLLFVQFLRRAHGFLLRWRTFRSKEQTVTEKSMN